LVNQNSTGFLQISRAHGQMHPKNFGLLVDLGGKWANNSGRVLGGVEQIGLNDQNRSIFAGLGPELGID